MIFQVGTGPSITRAPCREGVDQRRAPNTNGSLSSDGALRTDTAVKPPAPDRQTMPAPRPPSGNATRSALAPA